ncbi:MAG: SdpI family protein [Patescibacteria group bacterium]
MKIQYTIITALIITAIIATIYVYPLLPELVPSHWNALGEVDAYTKKNVHVTFMLGICIVLPIFMRILPKLDPKYKNIKSFEGDFAWFTVVFTLFMIALYAYTTLYALGYQYPIQAFIIPAMSVLFYTTGLLLAKAKPNYSIGFRLPWTLDNEDNWNKTHKIASLSFRYGSFALLLTTLLGKYSFSVFMIALTFMALIPVIYSYRLHKTSR